MTVNHDAAAAAQLKKIRAELTAPTPQTLRYLRAALGIGSQDVCGQKSSRTQARRNPKTKDSAIGRPPLRRATKQLHTSGATSQNGSGNDAQMPDLSEKGRLQIATEVFNFTIKRLAEAVKKLEDSPASCQASKPLLRLTKLDQAVHEQPLNRKGDKHAANSEKGPKAEQLPDFGLMVECSHSALQYLRKCGATESQSGASKSAGYENGALILLQRSTSLSLTAQAIHQLSEIHQMYWDGRAKATPSSASSIPQLLLGRQDAANDSSSFEFTEIMQNQAIRLALLLAPACIGPELVTTLKPDTVGSPAWIILEGLRKGRLNPKQAGSKLQSIALAISRLCALTIKSSHEGAAHRDFLDLFGLSLRIKFESWAKMGHTPETAKEVWRPYHHALMQLTLNTKDLSTCSEDVLSSLTSLWDLLRIANCKPDMPLELAETLSGMLHAPEAFAVLVSILEEQLPTSNDTDLALHCQITATRLKAMPLDLSKTLISVTNMERRLDGGRTTPKVEVIKLLPRLSRLRKATAASVSIQYRKEENSGQGKSLQEIQVGLVRLTYACFRFLKRNMTTALGQTHESSRREGEQTFLMTLVRTVDAVLSANHAVAESSGLAQTAMETLKDCSVTIQELQIEYASAIAGSSIGSQCHQLRVRISQAFWSHYLAAIKQRIPSLEQAGILELSVQGLLELPASDQRTAYAALKFERLAYCYLEAHNFTRATIALESAIAANVGQGVLSNVVESLLSGPFHRVWYEQDSNYKAFGKVLATFGKIRLAHAPPDSINDGFYDDQSLPAIHRAVLLEKQIIAIFELDLDSRQLGVCAGKVDMLLQLLGPPEYQVYRLRLVNHLFLVGLKKRFPASASVLDSHTLQRLLSPPLAEKESTFLRKYEQELRALLCLQHGFYTGVAKNQGVQEAIKQLTCVLLPFTNLRQAENDCENLKAWISPLLLAIDYAVMTEEDRTAIMALEVLDRLADLGVDASQFCRKTILTCKSNIHLRLHEVDSAEKSLAVADKASVNEEIDPLTEVEFALAYSEFHLHVLNLEECSRWLHRAKSAWEGQHGSREPSLTKSRLKVQSLLCRATHLASRLAFQQEQLEQAVVFARQSAKIAASLWPAIENAWAAPFPRKISESVDAELHNMSTEFSKLDLTYKSVPKVVLNTFPQTPYVALCCSVFTHLAFLYSHCGIYQDAATFFEQALKVARKANQSAYEVAALSALGVLHARAGQTEKARGSLRSLAPLESRCKSEWLQVFKSVSQGEAYAALGDLAAAHLSLSAAKQHWPAINQARTGKDTKNETKPPASQRTTKRQDGRGLNAPATLTLPIRTTTVELKDIEARMSALEARLQLLEESEERTTASGATLEQNGRHDGRTLVSVARGLVQSALKTFAEDAVHSVLAETAVAFPVRYRSARKGGRVSFVQLAASQALITPQDPSTKPKSAEATVIEGSALLLEAYDMLHSLSESRSDRLSSDVVSTCHKILTQITLLSTALNQPVATSSLNVVLDITGPLDLARSRENFITLGELTAARMIGMQDWPTDDHIDYGNRFLVSTSALDCDTKLLPASWSVVCLVLNEDKNELFVARLTHAKSPFVVRIPLARPDPSDGETEELGLDGAKAEMQDIIAQANTTAHAASGSSADKSVRVAWFAERQKLDEQLSTLLDNLENVWLGGFRGLLSGCQTDKNRLTSFGQRLCSTLNRHLPSRQKMSRPSASIELHDHVLELFVGLGHPQETDLEDAVTDLLYFVIDILQFNGERNAYDEIDFDAMLVEVLEALHAYHDIRTDFQVTENHVILVLDKELQLFPWESLPCLRGVAVSRMPSLGTIWQRLQTMSARPHDPKGYRIPKTNGAYILNPSSDLKSTQETFSQLFESQLPSYKAIVNRPPEAHELETALKEHDLLLYFGHGGGGQYIRPRAIRKMDKCAVTLLMGCSSAKMTECGVYEPYGMPFNYISGGSPAVVGTLWDVTDRDIDRFALELMEDWGLINGHDRCSAQPAKKSGKKTGKVKDAHHPHEPVSLDQAVANAREACLLKYLNGAAPVVYGVPVMLD